MEKLIAAIERVSEREAMNHVHRRLTLYMCGLCYPRWTEDPTGQQV